MLYLGRMQVGVLYSENKAVVGMVSKMAHTSQASSDTMDLVGQLFREPGFLDDYFRQHQASQPPLRPAGDGEKLCMRRRYMY